ncbi:hypothetical protein E9232_004910 [Inquilinus ginsengisoli]|uniref:Uncharacterized protein n=1 Tax=Inquilinus ginsengisoli TaxID=363840 RepID=A0ABU1JUS4_9PROT|nr:hypothetical protein [Inquilinus ginsengisoli]MDR6292370.1 hypothetical protein [Inquilinus ginsengisoli]
MARTPKPSEPEATVPETTANVEAPVEPVYTRDDYNAVAGSAELAQIILVSSAFDVKPDYWRCMKERPDSLKHGYDWDLVNYSYSPEQGAAMSNIDFKIDVRCKRKIVLSVDCSYLVIYSGIKEMNKAAVEAFMRRIGRFAAYPYFRAHVSQLSWESNTGLPVLPTIRS